MAIVCLGWGSLVWQPKTLPVVGRWHEDGPSLSLEFARQSMDGRITLVVTEGRSLCPALWAELGVASCDEAQRVLSEREGPGFNPARVAFWSFTDASTRPETAAIGAWAKKRGFEAVVWTALPPKFGGQNGRMPSEEEVVAYLRRRPCSSRAPRGRVD